MGIRVAVSLNRAVAGKLTAGAEVGVRLGAEYVLTESNRHVPIEEGTLLRSGTVDSDGTTASVSYNTPYAARQHEELDYHHDAGRTAKFLENATHTGAEHVGEIIARSIGQAL